MRRFHQTQDGPGLIHTVEVSDGSDPAHFVTLWLKGTVGVEWANAAGLEDHHDPHTYHAGARNYGWLPVQWPGREGRGWSKHRHLDTPAAPTWSVLEPFVSQLGPGLRQQLQEYFGVTPTA